MPHSYEDATGDLLVKLTDSCNFYNANNGTEKSPDSLAAFKVKAVDNTATDFVLTFTGGASSIELSDEDGNVVTNTGTASGTAGAAFAAGNYLKISLSVI